ncbi:MAG: hypothetical protein JEZ14_13450 [Marinilabiliaceae bacterium]|nr:hypothetical protein [Marinilabiliaceae bacterium]
MLIMSALVLVSFIAADLYYRHDNNAVDPRIQQARELYSRYDGYAQNNDFKAVFNLLDSIESIYHSIPYYSQSYEIGVITNNKAAAYLSMALYFDSNSISLDGITSLSKDTLLFMGGTVARKSISCYEKWLKSFGDKSPDELEALLKTEFLTDLATYPTNMKKRFLQKRLEEMEKAQYETPRRLSVAYTNLGIVKRHNEDYEGAINCYTKAMELWDRNLTAENNLHVLIGLPLKKQSVLEKIFPPEKRE